MSLHRSPFLGYDCALRGPATQVLDQEDSWLHAVVRQFLAKLCAHLYLANGTLPSCVRLLRCRYGPPLETQKGVVCRSLRHSRCHSISELPSHQLCCHPSADILTAQHCCLRGKYEYAMAYLFLVLHSSSELGGRDDLLSRSDAVFRSMGANCHSICTLWGFRTWSRYQTDVQILVPMVEEVLRAGCPEEESGLYHCCADLLSDVVSSPWGGSLVTERTPSLCFRRIIPTCGVRVHGP